MSTPPERPGQDTPTSAPPPSCVEYVLCWECHGQRVPEYDCPICGGTGSREVTGVDAARIQSARHAPPIPAAIIDALMTEKHDEAGHRWHAEQQIAADGEELTSLRERLTDATAELSRLRASLDSERRDGALLDWLDTGACIVPAWDGDGARVGVVAQDLNGKTWRRKTAREAIAAASRSTKEAHQ